MLGAVAQKIKNDNKTGGEDEKGLHGVEVEAEPEVEVTGMDPATLKIGAILVHDENSGYDMAHIEGLLTACEALGIPEENISFKYNIPETEAAAESVEETTKKNSVPAIQKAEEKSPDTDGIDSAMNQFNGKK